METAPLPMLIIEGVGSVPSATLRELSQARVRVKRLPQESRSSYKVRGFPSPQRNGRSGGGREWKTRLTGQYPELFAILAFAFFTELSAVLSRH